MRLNQIYNIVRDNYESVSKFTGTQTGNSPQIFQIDSWGDCFESLEELVSIKALKTDVDKIFSFSPVLLEYKKSISVEAALYNKLIKAFKELSGKMKAIMELYESMGMEEKKCGFDVMLPYEESFDKFTSNITQFNKFLTTCPATCSSNIKLTGSDVGSTWLTFAIAGMPALLALGKFVKYAMEIRLLNLQCLQAKQTIRINDRAEALLDNLDKNYNDLIESQSSAIATEIQNETEWKAPEDHKKIAEAIKILGDLMSKGLELHPSLDSPEDVTAAFPKAETQKLPVFAPKYLEEKADTATEEKEDKLSKSGEEKK